MGIGLAGLAANASGLISSLTSASTLVQFQNDQRETLVQFDAVISEAFTQQSQPTAYPVEDGSSVSDHIARLPLQLDITGIVSDTPIGGTGNIITEGIATAATALLPPLGVVAAGVAANALFTAKSSSPSLKVYNALRAMQIGTPNSSPPTPPMLFTVVSKLGRYENMVIVNMVTPRDVDTGLSLIFQLSLVQMVIVKPQTIELTALDIPALGAGVQALGSQATQEVSGAENINYSLYHAGKVVGSSDASSGLGAIGLGGS